MGSRNRTSTISFLAEKPHNLTAIDKSGEVDYLILGVLHHEVVNSGAETRIFVEKILKCLLIQMVLVEGPGVSLGGRT